MKQVLRIQRYWRDLGTRRRQLTAVAAALLLVAALLPTLAVRDAASRATPNFIATLSDNPARLSETDSALYNESFAAEARGDAKASDALLAQLANPRLTGYVLATRYLGGSYTASASELVAWLTAYGDHPQAASIRRLAVARGAHAPAIPNNAPLKGEGYADHLGRSGMTDGWYRALTLWREKNYDAALPLFAAVGDDESLSGWQRSAGNYWAYRAAVRLGNRQEQQKHLALAANYPTTFYGLLATQHFSAPQIEAEAPHVTRSLRQNPQALRAALLAQLDRGDDAEAELRLLYNRVDSDERAGLVTLAHELNLPNLQVRLASMPQLSASQALFAKFPTPEFILSAQEAIDPALLLAIARNESAFREIASSSAGAVGIMQILPSTAHAIERHVGRDALNLASSGNDLGPIAKRLNDPATSARYSAQYLKILAREAAVGNNLVRTLAAYNAGPGNVAGWQAIARQADDDSLLYIESIPYPETRNYVMQVMAQYWTYQLLQNQTPETLSVLDRGEWPKLTPDA